MFSDRVWCNWFMNSYRNNKIQINKKPALLGAGLVFRNSINMN